MNRASRLILAILALSLTTIACLEKVEPPEAEGSPALDAGQLLDGSVNDRPSPPLDTGRDHGLLDLPAPDGSAPPDPIGEGTDRPPPVAICGVAKVNDCPPWPVDPHCYRQELESHPLETIQLSGEGSQDEGGGVARYLWSVTERPRHSAARLDPGPDVSMPTFFLDLAGRYVFELVVLDEHNQPSAPCRVTVDSIPCCEDLHVQLVWRTPSPPALPDDCDPPGPCVGTDMDLHLLRMPGRWFDVPQDCYSANPSPDWGQPLDPDDDPFLDIDDVDGDGPENISLSEMEDDVVYRVGVNYSNDLGFGESLATVRVFIFGMLRMEQTRLMPGSGSFWDVAAIAWPAGQIIEIDRLLEGLSE